MKMAISCFLVFSVLCLVSCPTGVSVVENHGCLVLTFSTSDLAAKTIVPPLDMAVATYSISGDGPKAEAFSQTGVTTAAVVKNGLAAGAWTIVVDAFNSGGDLIGSGSTAVMVYPGATAQATVTVNPLSGTGSMTISITWPSQAIPNPVLSGSIAVVGGTPETIPFTIGIDSASCSYPSLSVGYYSLTIQLADGVARRWGSFDAVRILKDQATTVDYALTLGDINVGSMNVEIVPVMQNPIGITFSGQLPELPLGVAMTVAAATSGTVDSYQWYLNGALMPGATDSSVTVGSDLSIGHYRLDLGVWEGNVVSSERITFSVKDLPAEVVTTNTGEMGTQLDIYFYRGPEFGVTAWPVYTIWVEDMDGIFMQNLFVCKSVGTNIYGYPNNWVARPQASPYWAHKSCTENPYAGIPGRDLPGVYLALPTVDGGPIPSDLDAVTGATRQVDFRLSTARKDDEVSRFQVLLELQQSWDWNDTFPQASYPIGGQPPLVYGATVETGVSKKDYVMTLLGTGHPSGSDGILHTTDGLTTALEQVGTVIVHVK